VVMPMMGRRMTSASPAPTLPNESAAQIRSK
jgi:hypothetical protein